MSQLSMIGLRPSASPVDRFAPKEVRLQQTDDLTELAQGLAMLGGATRQIADRRLEHAVNQGVAEIEAKVQADAQNRIKNLDDFKQASAAGQIEYQDIPWAMKALKQQVSRNVVAANVARASEQYLTNIREFDVTGGSDAVRTYFIEQAQAGLDQDDPFVVAAVAEDIQRAADRWSNHYAQQRSQARIEEGNNAVRDGVFNAFIGASRGQTSEFWGPKPNSAALAAEINKTITGQLGLMPDDAMRANVVAGIYTAALQSRDADLAASLMGQISVGGKPLKDTVEGAKALADIREQVENMEDRDTARARQRENEADREQESLLEDSLARHVISGKAANTWVPSEQDRNAVAPNILMNAMLHAAKLDADMAQLSTSQTGRELAKEITRIMATNPEITPKALKDTPWRGSTIGELVAEQGLGGVFSETMQAMTDPVSADDYQAMLSNAAAGTLTFSQLNAVQHRMPRENFERLRRVVEMPKDNPIMAELRALSGRSKSRSSSSSEYMMEDEDVLDGVSAMDTLRLSIETAAALENQANAESAAGDLSGLSAMPRISEATIKSNVQRARIEMMGRLSEMLANQELVADPTKQREAIEKALWEVSSRYNGFHDRAGLFTAGTAQEKAATEQAKAIEGPLPRASEEDAEDLDAKRIEANENMLAALDAGDTSAADYWADIRLSAAQAQRIADYTVAIDSGVNALTARDRLAPSSERRVGPAGPYYVTGKVANGGPAERPYTGTDMFVPFDKNSRRYKNAVADIEAVMATGDKGKTFETLRKYMAPQEIGINGIYGGPPTEYMIVPAIAFYTTPAEAKAGISQWAARLGMSADEAKELTQLAIRSIKLLQPEAQPQP